MDFKETDLWNYGIIGALILGGLMVINSIKHKPFTPPPVKANVGKTCGCNG